MKKLPLILLCVVLAGFIFGLIKLFKIRFETGDIYPKYSSLRADPLGAKAFYESLDSLIPARRNYQPFSKLPDGRDTSLFFLGVEAKELRLTPEDFKRFEAFASDGGRVIISLLPSYRKPSPSLPTKTLAGTTNAPVSKKKNLPLPKSSPTDDDEESEENGTISIKERWSLNFSYAALPKNDKDGFAAEPALLKADADLPESISCHTALYFSQLDKNWRVIYARTNDRPVVIERNYGSGSVVLVADSFHFSNEAMMKDRQPVILSWMVGPSRHALFDETHLGVQESTGIAALGRKYRLHGVFAGLILLAGLFVWKNSISFMPPYEDQALRERGEHVAGKESAAGFVNLLRRNIPARDLLGTCLLEWNKSCRHGTPTPKLQQIQTIIDTENNLPPKERNPVRTYQAISKVLAKYKIKS